MAENRLKFHPFPRCPLIDLDSDGYSATFTYDEENLIFCHRPIDINETMRVQLSKFDHSKCPLLTLVLTHINPTTLIPFDCDVIWKKLENHKKTWLIDLVEEELFEANEFRNISFDQKGNLKVIDSGEIELETRVDVSKPLWAIFYIEPSEDYDSFEAKFASISLIHQIAPKVVPAKQKTRSKSDNCYSGYFHSMHGDTIELSKSRKTAKCISDDATQRFIFSSRPIKPLERIQLTFGSIDHSEVFGFGFTSLDPSFDDSKDAHVLLESATTWTFNTAIKNEKSTLIFFYNEASDVTFILDGKETVFKRRKIEQKTKNWAILYLRGLGATVTLVNKNSNKKQEESILNSMKPLIYKRTPQVWFFARESFKNSEQIVVKVKHVQKTERNSILLGLTSCDPKHVDINKIPNNSDMKRNESRDWFLIFNRSITDRDIGHQFSCSRRRNTIVFRKNKQRPENINIPIDLRKSSWFFVKLSAPNVRLDFYRRKSGGIIPGKAGNSVALQEGACGISASPLKAQTKQAVVPGPSSSGISEELEECTICYDNKIDAVLYACGHMCMCIKCARKQWKGQGMTGLCPICREPIKDVIKTFK